MKRPSEQAWPACTVCETPLDAHHDDLCAVCVENVPDIACICCESECERGAECKCRAEDETTENGW